MTIAEATEPTTLQQAAATSGASFWATEEIDGLPPVVMADGPHGLRQQDATKGVDHLGIRPSLPATCFPPAVGLAQTWDPELVRRVGEALGDECAAAGVNVLLGPGVNIKRDPRGGRNFEYYSEDPLLAGTLAAAWVQGIQSRGVGAALKHFAANNQETDRMQVSADIDPRPLHEIYLRPFQRVIQDAKPWTVMCSYNKVNGVYASQNQWLLTEVLRDQWGFDGVVVSDWGAVDDRIAALAAGLDLAMPGADEAGDVAVADAVNKGALDPKALDRAQSRLRLLAERAAEGARTDASWDADAHHALAREVAGHAIVLLKNDNELLPLSPSGALAVIGEFATAPRYQGGGSSHVNATHVDIPLEEIRALAGHADLRHAPGFTTDGTGDAPALRHEAVQLAASCDTAVVFLGVAAGQESEGFDRDDIELPPEQLELLRDVATAQPRTVVVLSHGGALRLAPIAALAPAILDAALIGQAAGGAIADVLFGRVNPSGRLAETVPERLEDSPAFTSFPGESGHVRYAEGIHVGYRWYDARRTPVTFPFGHGLSYTNFTYHDLRLRQDHEGVEATVRITNSGGRSGTEIVQLYASVTSSRILRAPRSLVGFQSVPLGAGEERDVIIRIRHDDLSYWNEEAGRFCLEDAEYLIHAGASSRDLRLTAALRVTGETATRRLTGESSINEVLADPTASAALGAYFAPVLKQAGQAGGGNGIDMARMLGTVPIRRFIPNLGGAITWPGVEQILKDANARNRF